MRPVIYGYMRLGGNGEEEGESRVVEDELGHHADREGFFLERVFMEHLRSSEHSFQSMVDALRRSDVKNVIVPSLWHFARLPGLQDAMRQHIEREIGARLWVVQGVHR